MTTAQTQDTIFMARRLLLTTDEPEDEFEACVFSLALELDAAIADRWIEWQDAREAGWPLDRPLVER